VRYGRIERKLGLWLASQDLTPKDFLRGQAKLALGSRPTRLACGNGGAEMRCRYLEGRATHRAFVSIFRAAAFTLRLVVREFVHREEHFYSSSSFSTISNSRWSSVVPPGVMNPAARFGPRETIVQAIFSMSYSVNAFMFT
jgi:hypothetical protein